MSADETLSRWLARAQELRARRDAGGAAFGLVRPEAVAGKSGLQVLQAMLAGEIPTPYMAQTLDYMLVEVAEGEAVFQGTPQVVHSNPMGSVHGGWYATLLDSALGCAVHTTLPAGQGYTTVELSVNIVRGATPDAGPLRAIARVIHSGRQLATAEGRIVDAAGRIYAHGTTTCLVFQHRPG